MDRNHLTFYIKYFFYFHLCKDKLKKEIDFLEAILSSEAGNDRTPKLRLET